MNAQPQIRMLRTMCHCIGMVIEKHEYGEFLEAGAVIFRDILCRTADQLEAEDKALAARLLPKKGDVTYNPKGKAST